MNGSRLPVIHAGLPTLATADRRELLKAIDCARTEFSAFYRYMSAGDNNAAVRCVINAESYLTRAAIGQPQIKEITS